MDTEKICFNLVASSIGYSFRIDVNLVYLKSGNFFNKALQKQYKMIK